MNTIRIPLPSGPSQTADAFDTLELPRGLPEIVSAGLDEGGRTRSIL